MESTEALHRRIENLEDLRQIVRTMKALSAVSVRQYERAAASLAEYDRTVELGLAALLREPGVGTGLRRPGARRLGRVVFGSDHGLCGRFNEVVAERALREAHEGMEGIEGRQGPWLAVGERAAAALAPAIAGGLRVMQVPSSAAGITALVQRLLLRVDAWRAEGIDRVELFHNSPTARGGYEPRAQRLFPVELGRFARRKKEPWPSRRLPQHSIERDRLLGRLLRQNYFVVLFRACAESLAAEHSSRLAAMQAAEKNIDGRIDEVTGRFRRVRQEKITSELLDVVSGFEAVS